MTTNIAGVISVVFFYIIILVVGIWAGKKKKTNPGSDLEESEEVMLAGRNIGMFVGIFTMTGELFYTMLTIQGFLVDISTFYVSKHKHTGE